MVFSSYYNLENKCLIITSDNQVASTKEEGNDLYFYNEEGNVIGANLCLEYDKAGLVDLKAINDPRLEQFINDEPPFKYGLIKTIEDHPNSDHLHICQVNDGVDKQIVCGAKNVEAGKVAIVAQIGAVMPSGLAIKPSTLLKVDSCGMMCSLFELGLADKSEGIFLSDNLDLQGQAFKE